LVQESLAGPCLNPDPWLSQTSCDSKRRETEVILKCGKVTELGPPSEPHTCTYQIDLFTPLACTSNASGTPFPLFLPSNRYFSHNHYRNYTCTQPDAVFSSCLARICFVLKFHPVSGVSIVLPSPLFSFRNNGCTPAPTQHGGHSWKTVVSGCHD